MTFTTYLVGGAVRDKLMNRDVEDLDFVVVGATPNDLLSRGFKQVGADFPVFIQPKTRHEYALARREKKTGTGYTGFDTTFSPDVTLEEDLSRRDLTINAIAQCQDTGEYIDPFNGMKDIEANVLRHVSNAFSEDPVRVLRVARFRARFGPFWTVAPETRDLMHTMAKRGLLEELTAERVWKEMSRALMEPHPDLFFRTLLETDTLKAIFPEIWKLKTALESYRWHPEGDAFEHTMLVLKQAARNGYDLATRYACLVHDIGKGLTPTDKLPSHHGHDVKGKPLSIEFSNRLTVPAKIRDDAAHATRYHMYMHKLGEITGKTYVKMFDDMRAISDKHAVDVLHRVGVCDERGRLGSENNEIGQLDFLLLAHRAYKNVRFDDVFPNGETRGGVIREGMKRARIAAIENLKKGYFDENA